MPIGTVKWYDYRKGYGFITGPEGEDIMAHFAVIEGDGFRRLYHGEAVEYEVTRGPRGLQATFVRHINNRTPREIARSAAKRTLGSVGSQRR